MACSAVGLAVVLAVLAPVLSSWRVPYLNKGSFEGEGVVVVPACSTAPELL
jgi:hypothetical protein